MKNLKKVLALVIVFAMMMSTAAFAGSVFPDVADDATYASAVTTLSQLGFFTGDDKGNFNPDATITRAEYAVIMTRLAGITASGTADFTDVPASHWATGYINAASQNGLIKGYGDGNFGPEDPVKYEEAVTMLIRALGYEPLAVSKGGYPQGYITVASQYGLLAGVTGTQGAGAPRAVVAVMTYNALDIPVVEQTGFGTDVKYEIMKKNDDHDKATLLTRLGIYKLGGVTVANEKVAYVGSVEDKGYIQIRVTDDYDNPVKALSFDDKGKLTEGKEYQFKDENGLTENIMAMNATFYLKEYASNKYEVVAAELDDGSTDSVVVDAADIDLAETNFDKASVAYYKDGASKTSTLKLEPFDSTTRKYSIVVNNTVIEDGSDYKQFITDFNNDKFTGDVEFIDWDNNNKYDIVKFTVYTHVIVDSVNKNAGTITTYNKGAKKIDLDVDNDDAVVSVKDTKGNAVDYTTLKEYDVLALIVAPYDLTSLNDASYTSLDVVVLGDSKVTGKVKGQGKDSSTNEAYITIDGKRYTVTAEKTMYTENDIDLGSEGDFFIGIDGKVVGFKGSKSSNSNYGFVISAYAPDGSSNANMTILNKEGKVVTYNYASKIEFINPDSENSVKISLTDTDFKDVNKIVKDTTWASIFSAKNVKKSLAKAFDADLVALKDYGTGKESDADKELVIKERLIKFDVNASGELDEIIPSSTKSSSDFTAYIAGTEASPVTYKASTQKLDRALADDAVIFNIDWDDFNDSTIKDLTFLVDDDEYSAVLYDKNDDAEYGAVVLKNSDATFVSGSPLAIVTDVEDTEDADGEKTLTITATVAGETKTIVFNDDTDNKTTVGSSWSDIKFGTILLYNADAKGIVDAYAVVGKVSYDSNNENPEFAFNKDFKTNPSKFNVDPSKATDDDAYYFGVLTKNGSKAVDINVIDRVSADKSSSVSLSGLSNADEYYFTKKGRNKSLTVGTSVDSIEEASTDSNYLVLVRVNEDSIQEIFAFNREYTDAEISKITPASTSEVKAEEVKKETKTETEVKAEDTVKEETVELEDVEIDL